MLLEILYSRLQQQHLQHQTLIAAILSQSVRTIVYIFATLQVVMTQISEMRFTLFQKTQLIRQATQQKLLVRLVVSITE